MKKLLLALIATTGLWACTGEEDEPLTGEIYGVVTVKETAEPMRATGVELFHNDNLLLKTVTYDDGHYEFKDLGTGSYTLKVVASGYADVSYAVEVQSGRTARADMQLEKLNTGLTVQTADVTVTGNSATLTAEYKGNKATEVGFLYSKTNKETAQWTKLAAPAGNHKYNGKLSVYTFNTEIRNLTPGIWYVRAYAINKIGSTYGKTRSFTISNLPTTKTLAATNISRHTATLNGEVLYIGEPAYTEKGFVYSSFFQNPTLDDPDDTTIKIKSTGSSKDFSANLSGLIENTTYHYRTYIKSNEGTTYGESVTFTPNSLPRVQTLAVSNITITSATLNATVESKGDPTYTEKGFVYSSVFRDPTIEDATKVVVTGSSSEYSANITDLRNNTDYYVKAYIANNDGISYGETMTFSISFDFHTLSNDRLMIQLTDISSDSDVYSAEKLCDGSRIGGYADWRLPTVGECQIMDTYFDQLNLVSTRYWTARRSDRYLDCVFEFKGRQDMQAYADDHYRVRCVRSMAEGE